MEALGIDPKILLAQIINFSILLFLLKKFLYAPIIKMLDDRKTKIEQGLKDSEKAKEMLENVETETVMKNEKAFLDAKEIVESAKKEASEEAAKIIKKANHDADEMIKKAQNEASLAKEKALTAAKGEIGSLVALALDRITENGLDKTQKDKLTAKAIEEL